VLLAIIESGVNAPEILSAAWEQLNQEEQTHIINIVNDDTKAAPQAIADELVSCGKIELQTIKESAWRRGCTECVEVIAPTRARSPLPSARMGNNQ